MFLANNSGARVPSPNERISQRIATALVFWFEPFYSRWFTGRRPDGEYFSTASLGAMNPLSPLEEVLLLLAGLKNQLEPCLRAFKRYVHDYEAKTSLANYLLVLVASFDQEWQRLEHLGDSAEVKHTLVAASPTLKRIRRWRGLHRLRSSMLAHGFREKKDRLVNTSHLFGPTDAPTDFAGQLLLGELAVYAIATAICHHSGINAGALTKLLAIWPDEEPVPAEIATMAEFEREIQSVRTEMFSVDPRLERCFAGAKNGT